MADKDFNEWLSEFKTSIANYGYYTDFDKVIENANSIKIELNIMNSLINSKDVKNDFISLATKYPEILKCIPILLAVRSNEILITENNEAYEFNFASPNYSIEKYAEFMEKSGLFNIISSHLTNNLYDYVLGVETGLDSNGRKNRGGHLMEDLVEEYIIKSGKKYNKEMYIEDIEKEYGLDLSNISNKGSSTKRFDFVIEGTECLYCMEVNFYSSGGSKLNETARSYKMLAEETSTIKHVEFVWVTDGQGWSSAKGNLKETFDSMKMIFNLNELEKGCLSKLV